eukprot:SAG31_NODE_13283_length_879_cov_2.828205_1_plen_169_part_00
MLGSRPGPNFDQACYSNLGYMLTCIDGTGTLFMMLLVLYFCAVPEARPRPCVVQKAYCSTPARHRPLLGRSDSAQSAADARLLKKMAARSGAHEPGGGDRARRPLYTSAPGGAVPDAAARRAPSVDGAPPPQRKKRRTEAEKGSPAVSSVVLGCGSAREESMVHVVVL